MEVYEYIKDILQNFIRIVQSISFFDVLDILMLTVVIFYVLKLTKETRAMQLLKGIVLLILLYVLVQLCNLKAMSFIMENFLQVGILAIIIVFQPELRRILEKVGRTRMSTLTMSVSERSSGDAAREKCINVIAEACQSLHDSKTGALIVIERETKLGEIIEKDNCIIVDAEPSPQLLCNLFFNKAPLHDGAVIIRNNRIYAAGGFVQNTTRDQSLDPSLGSRHRAALGASETSDALVIVVSEETGTISIALDGQLTRNMNAQSLKEVLEKYMPIAQKKKERRERTKKLSDREETRQKSDK